MPLLKKRYWVIKLGVSLLFLGFFLPLFLPSMGFFLVKIDSPPKKADLAIVLSGDAGARVVLASGLYKSGVVPRILMTGGGQYYSKYLSEYMFDFARAQSVPAEAILQERASFSTYMDAVETLKICESQQVRSIILVTSLHHTRRSGWVFRKVYYKSGIKIYVVGAEDGINFQRWWRSRVMTQKILIEWGKNLLYWVKY